MARVYSLPVFNLVCRVWFNYLPDDLSTWDGLVPSIPPDVSTACQLYYPRWGLGRWLHALGDSCVKSLLNAGVQELRYDKNVDLQAPWGVSNVTHWSEVPLCEVPSGSGRLYAVCLQEKKHGGFINEYAVSVLAQIGPVPPSPPPPPPAVHPALGSGSAIGVVVLPPALVADLPAGSGFGVLDPVAAFPDLPAGSGFGVAPPTFGRMGSGSALEVASTPTAPRRSLPAGSGFSEISINPPVADGKLPSGTALTAQELLPSKVRALPAGSAIALGALPPKYAPGDGVGSALTADYRAVVLRNPCASIGAPISIVLACTSQTGTLTGFTGLSVTLTYNSGPGNWTGTLTRSGKSGTITGTSTAAGKFNFSGSSGADWSISSTLGDDTVSCGPPFSGTSGNHSTTAAGPQSGNTVWSYN
jgi:hypothetical protein